MSEIGPPWRALPSPDPQGSAPGGEISARYPARYPSGVGAAESPLSHFLGLLRRHLWLLFGIVAVSVGVASYLVRKQEPQYRATAVLRLEDDGPAITGLLDATGGGAGRLGDRVLSEMQVIRSRAIAEDVVDRLGLRLRSTTRGFTLSHLDEIVVDGNAAADSLLLQFVAKEVEVRSGSSRSRAGYGQPIEIDGVSLRVPSRPRVESALLRVESRSGAARRVQDNLTVRRREGTSVIDLGYTANDPRLARDIVNAVADAFVAANATAARQQTRRRRDFVEEQLATADSLVRDAQYALTEFRSSRQLYGTRDRLSSQQTGLIGIEVRREEMSADRRMYQGLLEGMLQDGPGGGAGDLSALVSAPGIAANPVVAQRYAELTGYQAERARLTAGTWGVSGSNPDVQRLDVLIAQTETRVVEAVRSHISALDARIRALDELQARSATAISTLPALEAEEMRLVEEAETFRTLADQLRGELQRARISEAVEAGQAAVLDYALEGSPVSNGATRRLVFGLIIGLMLGGGAAFLLEQNNTSIRRREDMEATLQVPGMTVIPQIQSNGKGTLRLGRLKLGTRAGDRRVSNGKYGQRSTSLVTLSNIRSSGSEAFRTLRTNLIFSQEIDSLRTMLVTSASKGEGKSTTSANLAVTFAQQGMRVLLVDADLRRPALDKLFGIPREPGLSNLLIHPELWENAIRPTSQETLHVLPAGSIPPNPAELLGGQRMTGLINLLQEKYDLVIFDSPPVLIAADASILASWVDGVLVIVRAGQTDRGAAQHTMQQLVGVGARIVGAVLNDPDARAFGYGGYYRYYNYESYTAAS